MWNWVRSPNRNPLFLQIPRLPLSKDNPANSCKVTKNILNTITLVSNLSTRLFIHLQNCLEVHRMFQLLEVVLCRLDGLYVFRYERIVHKLLVITGRKDTTFFWITAIFRGKSVSTRLVVHVLHHKPLNWLNGFPRSLFNNNKGWHNVLIKCHYAIMPFAFFIFCRALLKYVYLLYII